MAAAQARTDAQQKSCERVHPVPHDRIGSESPTKTSEALAGVRSGRGLGFFSRTSNDVLDVTIQLGCDINPLIMTPTPQLTRVLKPALRRGLMKNIGPKRRTATSPIRVVPKTFDYGTPDALRQGPRPGNHLVYERRAAETEHEHADPPGVHVLRRGTGRDAAQLVRAIIANHDEQARTAHDVAEAADRDQLPDRVRRLLDRRTNAVYRRRAAYRNWCDANAEQLIERQRWIDQHLSRSHEQSRGCGIEL